LKKKKKYKMKSCLSLDLVVHGFSVKNKCEFEKKKESKIVFVSLRNQ